MSTKLYVGNLAHSVTEIELQDLFAQYGAVAEVNILMDRMTARPRGFGFVTMSTDAEAEAATAALNGKDLAGRALVVNPARPREEGAPRSFGGGGGGGGGGGRGPRRSFGGGGGGGGPRRGGGGYSGGY